MLDGFFSGRSFFRFEVTLDYLVRIGLFILFDFLFGLRRFGGFAFLGAFSAFLLAHFVVLFHDLVSEHEITELRYKHKAQNERQKRGEQHHEYRQRNGEVVLEIDIRRVDKLRRVRNAYDVEHDFARIKRDNFHSVLLFIQLFRGEHEFTRFFYFGIKRYGGDELAVELDLYRSVARARRGIQREAVALEPDHRFGIFLLSY